MVTSKHYRERKDQVADTYSNLDEQTPPQVFVLHNEQMICIMKYYSYSDSFLKPLCNFRIAVMIHVVLLAKLRAKMEDQ